MATVTAKLEKSGRILIPAEIRRQLKLSEGSEVLLRLDENGLTLTTREQVLERIRKRLAEIIPPGHDLAQELIADRRAETEHEG